MRQRKNEGKTKENIHATILVTRQEAMTRIAKNDSKISSREILCCLMGMTTYYFNKLGFCPKSFDGLV